MKEENEENKLIIVFNPLNTLYSYDFEYLPRDQHVQKYNQYNNNEIKQHISLLPFIEKEIIQRYTKEKIISYFRYYTSSDEETKVIKHEHALLNLDTYYKAKFISKTQLENNTNQKVIFISENVNDFMSIVNNNNIYKIANWMIYKENSIYLNYQKQTIPLLSYNHKPLLYDLIIECFRQASNVILHLYKYCINNSNNIDISQIIKEYFKDAINAVYILDTNSTMKLYRKRELAQSSSLVKYHPFLNKNFPCDNQLFEYPPIHIWVQRCPYYYFINKEYTINNIQNIIDLHPDIVQLHPIKIVDILFDRYAVFEYLKDFISNCSNEIKTIIGDNYTLTIPQSIKFCIDCSKTAQENLNNVIHLMKTNAHLIEYPVIIKPYSCTRHDMEFILNENGLRNLFMNETKYNSFILSNKEFIIQKYIKHGGIMIKNYSINEESYSFIRPSLPDMDNNEVINSVKSLNDDGLLSFYNEMIYKKTDTDLFKHSNTKKEEDFYVKINNEMEKINKISLLFVQETKLTFYGLDFLYNEDTNTFYLLEINYFPSYRELGDNFHNKFDEHLVKYYNKFKK